MKKLLLIPLVLLSLAGGTLLGLPATSYAETDPGELIDDAQCTPSDFVDCNGLTNNVYDPAANTDPATGISCTQGETIGSGCNLVTKYLNPFINVLAIMVGIAVTIGIIHGGILYSASAGDPQKSANARRLIRNSVIALLGFFFLYAFLQFVIPGKGLVIF